MRRFTFASICCLIMLAAAEPASAATPRAWHQGGLVRADAVSVLFAPGAQPAQIERAVTAAHGRVAHLSDGSGQRRSLEQWSIALSADSRLSNRAVRARVMLDDLPLDPALAALNADPAVLEARPIPLYRLLYEPDDPYYYEYQSNLRQSRVDQAWDQSRGAGVLVAVIDTGYRSAGMEDAPHLLMPGRDFANNDDDALDTQGHGTLIANIVAEQTDNGVGAAGIAHAALVLPLKVFPDGEDMASSDDIADAVDYAVVCGADVINMSLGGDDDFEPLHDALERAAQADVLLVAAAGNEGEAGLLYPAAYPEVLAVGSVAPHEPGEVGARSDFSNFGEGLDLLAPGERIFQEGWSAKYGSAYYYASGTSASTPHVSATAALMIAVWGRVNAAELRQALQDSARDLDVAGYDEDTGFGELDAAAAVQQYAPASGALKPTAVIEYEIRGTQPPYELRLDSAGSRAAEGSLQRVLWLLPEGRVSDKAAERFNARGRVHVGLLVYDDDNRVGVALATIDTTPDRDDSSDSPFIELCGLDRTETAWAALLAALAFVTASARRKLRRRCRADTAARR